ncbi:hypothetical protein [Actinoplanes sp. NPDC051494]|uniref:hypothetical protein n=1 Tax=Actinoplanes sp. NPDC051494 TaxID=3363907 RepID=UPI003787AC14
MTIYGKSRRATAETMHDTAVEIERSEAILHECAERSPDEATARRLHSLGDQVTGEAKRIDARAHDLPPA